MPFGNSGVGLVIPCSPGRYCPDQPVTRGEAAGFLGAALGPPHGPSLFEDVEGHRFEAQINALAAAGIMDGCDPPRNDYFCPGDPLSRGQMASMLAEALSNLGRRSHQALPGVRDMDR